MLFRNKGGNKMKRRIVSIVTALLLCLGCVATFASCGTPSPTETANSFLEAVKTQDKDTLKSVYAGGDELDFSGTSLLGSSSDSSSLSNDVIKKFKKKLLDFDYEVTDENIKDNKATVKVKLTTYEFGEAMTNLYTEMLENIWTFSAMSDKQSDAFIEKLFSKQLDKLKEKSYSSTVKLKLTKSDDGWKVDKIDSDGEFMNGLAGNLIDTINSFDDSFDE